MRRKRLIAVIVAAAVLVAALFWLTVRRSEPSRPPEWFGKVVEVRNSAGSCTSFLIRFTTPNLAGWDSEQNAFHRKIDMPCWVAIRDGVTVLHRGGGVGELVVGQTVSAWCSGPMAESKPPIWDADFVVIEPDDR